MRHPSTDPEPLGYPPVVAPIPDAVPGSRSVIGSSLGFLRALVRWGEWYDSKIPLFLVGLFHGGLAGPVHGSAFLSDALVLLSLVFAFAAFGHLVNDLSDREADRAAGKPNKLGTLAPGQAVAVVVLSAGAGLAATVATQRDRPAALLAFALAYLVATLYSLPPVRLKERGLAGLFAAALAQRTLPAAAILLACGVHDGVAAGLVVLGTFVGLRFILVHQGVDAANDRASGIETFGTSRATSSLITWARRVFVLEAVALVLTMGLLVRRDPSFLILVLAYTAWILFRARIAARMGDPLRVESYHLLADLYGFAWPAFMGIRLFLRDPAILPLLLIFLQMQRRLVRREWILVRSQWKGPSQRRVEVEPGRRVRLGLFKDPASPGKAPELRLLAGPWSGKVLARTRWVEERGRRMAMLEVEYEAAPELEVEVDIKYLLVFARRPSSGEEVTITVRAPSPGEVDPVPEAPKPALAAVPLDREHRVEEARAALAAGIAFLSRPSADGGFSHLHRDPGGPWRPCHPLFATTTVLLAAGERLPADRLEAAVDSVKRSRRPDGLWDFDPALEIPVDSDTVACALASLARLAPPADRPGLADVDLLRRFWRTDGGPFQTWAGSGGWSRRDRDDPVVNCNVLTALRALGAEPTPEERRAALRLVHRTPRARYYCAPVTIAYAARRAGFVAKELPGALFVRPGTRGAFLPAAQWLTMKRRWDDELVAFLLASRDASGAWDTEDWFTAIDGRTWGSPDLSTALCVEALGAALDALRAGRLTPRSATRDPGAG